ncbi:hypothetical protein AQUCO_02000149v1 [Aquilegia coerulea]|uniref:Uncharacterized protein n=1 Tax=Aquilegia coerulea TaxID=218851 RepID=A0A2G5DG62_AQUCA|nr:hypothetical protein AQUCO_02000149v1 [Aquilegia coerulea]
MSGFFFLNIHVMHEVYLHCYCLIVGSKQCKTKDKLASKVSATQAAKDAALASKVAKGKPSTSKITKTNVVASDVAKEKVVVSKNTNTKNIVPIQGPTIQPCTNQSSGLSKGKPTSELVASNLPKQTWKPPRPIQSSRAPTFQPHFSIIRGPPPRAPLAPPSLGAPHMVPWRLPGVKPPSEKYTPTRPPP